MRQECLLSKCQNCQQKTSSSVPITGLRISELGTCSTVAAEVVCCFFCGRATGAELALRFLSDIVADAKMVAVGMLRDCELSSPRDDEWTLSSSSTTLHMLANSCAENSREAFETNYAVLNLRHALSKAKLRIRNAGRAKTVSLAGDRQRESVISRHRGMVLMM